MKRNTRQQLKPLSSSTHNSVAWSCIDSKQTSYPPTTIRRIEFPKSPGIFNGEMRHESQQTVAWIRTDFIYQQ